MEGEGASQTSSPWTTDHRLALLIVGLDLHAEGRALQLAGIHRQGWAAGRKAAVDICAAGDRVEMQVALDFPIHVLKTLRRTAASRSARSRAGSSGRNRIAGE